MPKVSIDFTKGLVQKQGGGFAVNSILRTSGTVSLDATTFLTVGTTTSALTLPASADTGTVKIIICDQGVATDNVVVKGTNCTTGDITLNATGEMVICVFNGTEWVVGRSLT
jgi:hypothetical protein